MCVSSVCVYVSVCQPQECRPILIAVGVDPSAALVDSTDIVKTRSSHPLAPSTVKGGGVRGGGSHGDTIKYGDRGCHSVLLSCWSDDRRNIFAVHCSVLGCESIFVI